MSYTETIAIIYVDAKGMREHLQSLAVPENMNVRFYPIPARERNRAAAFQRVMQQSDARYKVYVGEEIRIHRKSLLSDIVAAFQQHPDIGLLGLSGAKQLLTSGITYLASERVGIVLDGAGRPLIGTAARSLCEPVQAVDGYLLATQRDVDWRQDLLQETLFLGPSASCEFRRAGYGVAVLSEEAPACQLLRNALSADAREQEAFLDEYSKELYPLVSIIIPTYQRPEYFRQALESVVRQTYRNLDIFVTDNSHDEATKQVYEQYFSGDSRIRYEHHPEYDGAEANWHRANTYDNPDATYVNWLMDDDLFHPEKIAAMIDCFLQHPGVVLVTSYRRLIDADGKELPDAPWSKSPLASTTRVKGDGMGRAMLVNMLNIIGEPTTALVRKSALYRGHLGWPGESKKYWISDYPTWFHVLSQGDVIYMTEPLSFFRQHPGQQQKDGFVYAAGLICWALMVREALVHGIFLRTDADRLQAVVRWLLMSTEALDMLYQHPELQQRAYWKDFLKVYGGMADALSNGYHVAFDVETNQEAGK